MMQDVLFSQPMDPVADFVFDERVVAVFPDMIQRSVPGYAHVLAMSGVLAGYFAQPHSQLYDLGSSLGATCRAIQAHVNVEGCMLTGVDNAKAMVDACKEQFSTTTGKLPVRFVCEDIREAAIYNASVVTMNFTLQFVPLADREPLLRKIHAGMVSGGVFIMSEKIAFDDESKQRFFTELHHHFKRSNGYSELEIAQKRAAIEQVMIPETIETHLKRFKTIGFKTCEVWFQSLNFSAFLAIK
ncbi:MAG: carboxy-S-adenosyl-L-methionine synthase CmoA [Bacteroidetes Order II. Incertae sedis bacterium]|nr:carboxy-S-adenosyl-L-methionine synthase CmoA [Bacteroidetes Order II. bacterium]